MGDLILKAKWKPNALNPVVSATPSAVVTKTNGNTNILTITITETYADGSVKKLTQTFIIANNAKGSYWVGDYFVYVATYRNVKIDNCHIIQAPK